MALVATEGRGDEEADQLGRILGREEARAQAEDVAVVVIAAEANADRLVPDDGANPLVLVRGDAHARARAADQYAEGRFPPADEVSYSAGEIRVVHS